MRGSFRFAQDDNKKTRRVLGRGRAVVLGSGGGAGVGGCGVAAAGAAAGGGFRGVGGVLGVVVAEVAGGHGGGGLWVAHEHLPNEAGAEVFGHNDADADVDAEAVGVVPELFGVEGVAEAIAAPGVATEALVAGAEGADALLGEEGEGAGGGAGDDGAIDRAHEWRSAPGGVAVLPVGGGDAPEVVGVAALEGEEEGFVGAGGGDRVLEVVGVVVALAGEVKPGMRVLMDEERIAAGDEVEGAIADFGAGEGVPGAGWDGVSAGADGEEVEHHELAVVVPAGIDEACGGVPAHGEGGAAVEHPGPLDALVEAGGEVLDTTVVEVGAAGEDAAEEDGGVDRGDFAPAGGFAGGDVVEVVEEAVLVLHVVEVEVERGEDLALDGVGGDVALFVGDAKSGEAEACGSDGGGGALVAIAGGAAVDGAIEDLAGFGIGLLGEVEAAALLHFHEEGVVFGGEAFGWRHVVVVGVGLVVGGSVGWLSGLWPRCGTRRCFLRKCGSLDGEPGEERSS